MAIALVQETTAITTTGTPTTLALTISAAVAGHTLILIVNSDGTITTPSGWTALTGTPEIDFSSLGVYYKAAAGGETGLTVAWTGGTGTEAWLAEYSGLGTTVDVSAVTATGASSSTTATTGNAVTTYANDLLLVAVGSDHSFGYTAASWTNSFSDRANIISTGASRNTCMYVGSRTVSATGTYNSTATVGGGNSENHEETVIVAFKDNIAVVNASVTAVASSGLGRTGQLPTVSTGTDASVTGVASRGIGRTSPAVYGALINLVQHVEAPVIATASSTVNLVQPITGNVLVAWANADNAVSTPTGITGWTPAGSVLSGNALYLWVKTVAPGDGTQVIFTASGAGPMDCGVMEWSGLDPASPFDTSVTSTIGFVAGTTTTPVTASGTAVLGDLFISFAGLHSGSGAPSAPGWSNGFAQLIASGTTGASPSTVCYTFIGTQTFGGPASPTTAASWTGSLNDRQEILLGLRALVPGGVSITAVPGQGMGRESVNTVLAANTTNLAITALASRGLGLVPGPGSVQVDISVTSVAIRGMGAALAQVSGTGGGGVVTNNSVPSPGGVGWGQMGQVSVVLTNQTTPLAPTYIVGDLMEETRRSTLGMHRAEYNALAGALTASATSIQCQYAIMGIARGSYVAIDDEIIYVWLTDPATNNLPQVQRGMLGTKPAAHSAMAILEVNPRFARFAIRYALREEIRSWGPQVYRVKEAVINTTSGRRGYDLAALVADNFYGIISVRQNVPGNSSESWPKIRNWQVVRSAPLSDFPSGAALIIPEGRWAGTGHGQPTLTVVYSCPFVLDTFTDDVDLINTIGLDVTMIDIPALGAAWRLLSTRETQRTLPESQGQPSDLTNQPPMYVSRAASALKAQRDSRLNDVMVWLLNRYGLENWGM